MKLNDAQSDPEMIPRLFKQEYAKMTTILCRHFGLQYIEIAEDIVSDTFLKATEHWAIHGVPENPAAWLYTVAKNKTKDYFKHQAIFDEKVKKHIGAETIQNEDFFEIDQALLYDSQLTMIFAVCNPANSYENQICLALQILCGFSIEEISNAFLTKPETIKKRLQRARTHLRNDQFTLDHLNETEIESRLNAVLKTLYLLFNEGYFSKSHNKQIRIELCSEAVRLALLLTEHPLTNLPRTNALLALMCFQSSRLQARINDTNEMVLYEDQDKNLWDQSLIQRGNFYLVQATDKHEISKYHLEAAIAYWHTTPTDQNKWFQILQLYNQLILIEYSPITALSRTFAFSKVYGNIKAITEAEKLKLIDHIDYYKLLGYLYADHNKPEAIKVYKIALQLTKSNSEKQMIIKEIERLEQYE